MAVLSYFHYNSMATVSCHSNQSSYPFGLKKKTILFVPPAYRCYIRNMVRISSMASEEMSSENVDGRTTTDGRTEGRQMPGYTTSSPMSLWLR